MEQMTINKMLGIYYKFILMFPFQYTYYLKKKMDR